MSEQTTSHDEEVWRRLVDAHLSFAAAGKEFLSDGVNRVALMRAALGGRDRLTALYVAPHLDKRELAELFDELVFLASFSHGGVQAARDLVASLPRDWVLANVERVAEPLLREGDEDEYRRLLELYAGLDAQLTQRLARRAAASDNPHVREAGEDFLS